MKRFVLGLILGGTIGGFLALALSGRATRRLELERELGGGVVFGPSAETSSEPFTPRTLTDHVLLLASRLEARISAARAAARATFEERQQELMARFKAAQERGELPKESTK